MKNPTLLTFLGAAAALLCRPVSGEDAQPAGRTRQGGTNILPRAALSSRHFGNDAPWYERNIPFFDCSDPQITQIYYYRWKLYKSHLKDLGERGYIVTEFLDDVSWSLKPAESLNDATGFHISEGRWLKDRRYVDDYIDWMYHGGNDRHFSEAIADAVYSRYLADGDRAFAIRNLPAMKRIYQQWDDHFDKDMGLYYIEPLLDATEYTISSIDASGGRDGFRGGDAFRPTINSFMFANARAISKLSLLAGDAKSAAEYADRAATLRATMQQKLWNPSFQHFIDRYKVNNSFARYGDFIRGRELAGYTPWYFGLPDPSPEYAASWRHLLSPDQLGGASGLRTVEPSYANYLKQYRYVKEGASNRPECQWNGPSWPFQTTLALGGLANLLNDYPKQDVIDAGDYLRLLRQYTQQHYVNGQPDLQEDYDPDKGGVIVGLNRSHHYNHSAYNDLIITGLVGLRPRADETLEVNPLLPIPPLLPVAMTGPKASSTLSYFCLENALYHGRLVTILYDRDGRHYHRGAGLSVYINGRQALKPSPLAKRMLPLPASMAPLAPPALAPVNLAVNMTRGGFPMPAASINQNAEELHQATDGRVWFYPGLRNYWTNSGSQALKDWFSLDFGHLQSVDTALLYFYADGTRFRAPRRVTLQYWTGQDWANVANAASSSLTPLENGETTIRFLPVQTARMRAVFTNAAKSSIALVEMKLFGPKVAPPAAPNSAQAASRLKQERVTAQN